MDDTTRYLVDAINAKDERIITKLIRVIVVLVLCWLLSVASLVWYISLPVESYDVEQNDNNGGYNQIVGGDYNGLSEDKLQAESSQK